jgi:hypothetical protein
MSNHKPNHIMRFLLGLIILSLSCSLPAVAVTPQPVTQLVTQSPLPTLSFTPIMPPEIPPTSTPIAPPAVQPSSTPIAPPAIPPTRTLDLTPIAPPQIIPQLIPTYPKYQIIPQNNPGILATQQIFSINSQAAFPDIINAYFSSVVNGDYSTAWNMLSPAFKKTSHNDDYNNYVQGYTQMQLCDIVISNFQVEESSSSFGKISAHFVYKTGQNCVMSEYDFYLYFVYDQNQKSWLLDKIINK